MADSIQTMLDYRELTARYRQAPTLQEMPFTDNFFKGATPTTADEVTLYVVGRTNAPAQANTRGSNPRQLAGPNAKKKQYSLFNSFNELSLKSNAIRFLRVSDPAIQEMGREYIADQIDDAGRRQRLFREVVISQIMTVGMVFLDVDGNVLVPTVDATSGVVTVPASAVVKADFGVADSHRGGCGGIVGGALWSTPGTDMFAQLAKFRDAALKQSAEIPTTVWMHRIHIPDLINNTNFKVYAQQNSLRNEAVLNASGVDNIWGWNFRFLEGYWEDSTGTQKPILPSTNVILTPSSGDWLRCKEGTQEIPTTLEVKGTLEEALGTLKDVVGMFSFAQVRVTPLVTMSLYLGDNFGMGFTNPNAIWMPTVFAT